MEWKNNPLVKTPIFFSVLPVTAGVLILTGSAGMNSTKSAQAGLPEFSHPRDITNPCL
jgi:hypothetical protein